MSRLERLSLRRTIQGIKRKLKTKKKSGLSNPTETSTADGVARTDDPESGSSQMQLNLPSFDTIQQGIVPKSLLRIGFEHLNPDDTRQVVLIGPSEDVKHVNLPPDACQISIGNLTSKDPETSARAEGAVRSWMDVAAEAAATDDTIRIAIELHEAGELEKSFGYLRQAANRQVPLGLFLMGMALRHGWGCATDAELAIRYLHQAAETAAVELDQQIKGSLARAGSGTSPSSKAAKAELVLAIHELGMSFAHGWGLKKNKRIAAYYFELAAVLGDPDSQNEIARCYEKGLGVKKNVHTSAKYYRLAAAQGFPIMGNTWIYKDKYGGPMPSS